MTYTFRRHLARRIAAVTATLISAVVLLPSAAEAQSPSSLDQIYAALRPDNLRTTTGRTSFEPGNSVEFVFDLVNTSDQPLVIPLNHSFGTPFHLVGTKQTWIERLGPDPTIPGISPLVGRKGSWYASGGEILAYENLPEHTIPAGGRVSRQASLIHSTAGFPRGRYRFHVEYKPLFGGLFDVIATVSLDLTFGSVPSDETPPVLTVPDDVTVEATGPAGASHTWTAAATDDVDGAVPVTCVPSAGTTFAVGTTAVTCTATDSSGNSASAGFRVTVADTTPPALTTPGGATLDATAPQGAAFSWETAANDVVDGPVPVACVPLSGTTFAVGTTTVTCTAADSSGNSASASFEVVVIGAEGQLARLIESVSGLGPGTSLSDKLEEGRSALVGGDRVTACSKLKSFANEVQAQSGKKLTPDQAQELIDAADRIRAVLAC